MGTPTPPAAQPQNRYRLLVQILLVAAVVPQPLAIAGRTARPLKQARPVVPQLSEMVAFLVDIEYEYRTGGRETGSCPTMIPGLPSSLYSVSATAKRDFHPISTTRARALTTSYGMNVMKAPFDDVRVRKAMQLAIDLGTLNNALFGGLGDMTPRGILGGDTVGYHVPYEEWSDQLKADYGYDPERAEKLLDEAGYPRGADGVRFTTQLQYTSASSGNLDWTQAAKDYWAQIGVDVEIDIQEIAVFISNINGRTWEGMSWGEYAANSNGLYYARTHGHSAGNWNFSAAAYPEIDALIEAAESASTFEEMQRLVREWDMYAIENHWGVYGGVGPAWVVWQPWLGGYNGELQLGAAAHYAIPARIWIDQELKESMGH